MKHNILLIALFMLVVFGLILIFFSWAADPFTIPFPDYDQMLEERKLKYEQEHEAMKKLEFWGFITAATAFFSLIAVLIFRKFKGTSINSGRNS